MNIWAVILAAGKGSRLLQVTAGLAKQFFLYNGVPLYWQSVLQFTHCSKIHGFILVFPFESKDVEEQNVLSLIREYDIKLPYRVVVGGELRQHSVKNGLMQLPKNCTHVLIHDAARPFVSLSIINQIISSLDQKVEGVIPGVPVTETIKYVKQNKVEHTPNREELFSIQTPQGFQTSILVESHLNAEKNGWIVTDDASLLEKCGYRVYIIEGDVKNIKITYAEDLKMLDQGLKYIPIVGYGYDVHKYATLEKKEKQPSRPMKLGGVPIDLAPEIIAHSDGDVVFHALMDALLGCIGAGDIGQHFPDTDKVYDGINSSILLDEVLDKISKAGIKVIHTDITIVAQTPKISPYRLAIKKNIARLLSLDEKHVNIKATTEEGLGFIGECKGIKVIAVVTSIGTCD